MAPLKEGTSDKVVQENINCILNKDGCGYDPPYRDPARDSYTPAQAAAIAYAKAGRRNNTGKKGSAPKKTKDSEVKGNKTTKKEEEKPDVKKPGSDIKIPEGWRAQQSGGDTSTSKKNQPPKKKEEDKLTPEADKQMLDETMEGYKIKWGSGASLLEDAWDTYDLKQKKKFLEHAKKIKAKEQAKQSKEDNKTKTEAPSPAPVQTPSKGDIKGKKPAPKPEPKVPEGKTQKDDGWTSHLKPKFDDNGNITHQKKVYKPTKTLPGSTKPKLYSDEEGNPRFVVKEGGAEGQNDAEYAANQVYGILSSYLPTGAIRSRLIDGKLVNDFMPNSKTINDLTDEEFDKKRVISRVRKSLVADALVANWDYAGLANDNMMADNIGNILRIDSGGTFNYRAQGEQKEFDAVPMEMWTLRSSTQGKQFWNNAQESDYENLWLDQVSYILTEKDKLKNAIAKSNLSPEVKEAFNNRVDILSIAAQEANDIAKRDNVSWKQVDQVMERAFRYSSMMNTKDPDWADKVRNKIKTDLDKAFPEKPSEFNLKGGVIDQYDYEQKVKSATSKLNDKDDGWEAFNGMSEDEKYSVYSYTGGGYDKLNKYLRAGVGGNNPAYKEYYETKAKHLQSLLERLPSNPALMHRMNSVSSDANVNFYKNLKPGDIVTTKGFDSYTEDDTGSIMEAFAKGSYGSRLHFITQYQGKNTKNVNPITATPGEEESIMERGTRLRVTQVQMVSVSNFPNLEPSSVGGSKILMITNEDA